MKKLLKQKVLFEVEFEIEGFGLANDKSLQDIMEDICATKPPNFYAQPKLTIKSMRHLDEEHPAPSPART